MLNGYGIDKLRRNEENWSESSALESKGSIFNRTALAEVV